MPLTRSTSAASPQGNQGYLYCLDWLRFTAALMVVAIHSRGGTWVEWGRMAETPQTKLVGVFFALNRARTESVFLFFVLSGFLVGGKVIGRWAQEHPICGILYLLRIASFILFTWLCYLQVEKQTGHLRKWLQTVCIT